jgi:hypothetical protein
VSRAVNAYLSFKRVERVPPDAVRIATGTGASGVSYAVLVADNAMFVVTNVTDGGQSLMAFRVDFSRLIDSIICGGYVEEERWEPLRQDPDHPELWGNATLTASVHRYSDELVHISYHYRDRRPLRDWRVGQRVKNQLVGEDWEAVELYPRESRVVDTANESHLWCVPFDLPFGFQKGERATQDQVDEAHRQAGLGGEGPVQRDDPDADTAHFDPSPLADAAKVHVARFHDGA